MAKQKLRGGSREQTQIYNWRKRKHYYSQSSGYTEGGMVGNRSNVEESLSTAPSVKTSAAADLVECTRGSKSGIQDLLVHVDSDGGFISHSCPCVEVAAQGGPAGRLDTVVGY
jgi:hypothetical protein